MAARKKAKKEKKLPVGVVLAWPLGFAPPRPPTRMIIDGPLGYMEVIATPVIRDEVIEVTMDSCYWPGSTEGDDET